MAGAPADGVMESAGNADAPIPTGLRPTGEALELAAELALAEADCAAPAFEAAPLF